MSSQRSNPSATRTRIVDDDPTERGSVWDVPIDWRIKFWYIFSTLMLLAAGAEAMFQFTFGIEPTAWHLARVIITGTVLYTALVAPISILATEGIRLLSEKYLKKRFRDGLTEGEEIGVGKGVVIGEKRGEARGEARGEKRGVGRGVRATLEWVERRDAAIAAGMPFDEPPPDPATLASQTNGTTYGTNGSGNGATPNLVVNGNGATDLKAVAANAVDEAMTEFVQWSVRKGVAEALGQPFNEPHPYSGNRANGNGN